MFIIGCQTKSNATERQRSKIYFRLRAALRAEVTEDTMRAILDFNKQTIPNDYSDVSETIIFFYRLIPTIFSMQNSFWTTPPTLSTTEHWCHVTNAKTVNSSWEIGIMRATDTIAEML